MKKIPKSYKEEFPPVKLFLDDIEKIVEILAEQSSNDLEIKTEDYRLDDVHELSELPEKTLNFLHIDSYQPSIHFWLEETRAKLWTHDTKEISLDVIEQIKNIMHKRRRELAVLGSKNWLFIPVVVVSSMTASWSFKYPLLAFIAVPFSLFMLVLLFASGTIVSGYSIVLSKSDQYDSFWTRNSDKLWIAVISSFVTVGLTLFVQTILTRFFGD